MDVAPTDSLVPKKEGILVYVVSERPRAVRQEANAGTSRHAYDPRFPFLNFIARAVEEATNIEHPLVGSVGVFPQGSLGVHIDHRRQKRLGVPRP
jgi:hypothetical protein